MINSVNLGSSNLSIASVGQTKNSSSTAATAGTTATASTGDSAQISGPGKLFAELKQLAASDPTKFKAVAADIATKLKEAAGTTSGTTTANSPLADLAAKFQQAADTGDVSTLQPPSGGGRAHGHHHHHHGGVGTYNQQGQVQPSQGTTAANGADLKSLFDSISQEVSSAVGK